MLSWTLISFNLLSRGLLSLYIPFCWYSLFLLNISWGGNDEDELSLTMCKLSHISYFVEKWVTPSVCKEFPSFVYKRKKSCSCFSSFRKFLVKNFKKNHHFLFINEITKVKMNQNSFKLGRRKLRLNHNKDCIVRKLPWQINKEASTEFKRTEEIKQIISHDIIKIQ